MIFYIFTILANDLVNFTFNHDTYEYLKSLKNNDQRYIFGGIYDTISEHLSSNHAEISSKLSGDELLSNSTWEKTFGDYHISISRKVVPEAGTDRYFVYDTFKLSFFAEIYLARLYDLGIIDINMTTLQSFNGINFSREYTYVYPVDNYIEGYTYDISKLISIFKVFHQLNFETIEKGESLHFSQFFDSNNELSVRIPLYHFIKTGINLSLKKNVLNEIAIYQSLIPNEKFRISVSNFNDFLLSFGTSLEFDLYRVLALTVFSFTTDYTKMESGSLDIVIYPDDLEGLRNRNELYTQIRRVFRLSNIDPTSLGRNLISKIDHTQENSEIKLTILNFLNSTKETKEKITSVTPLGTNIFNRIYYSHGQLSSLPISVLNFFGKDFIMANMAYNGVTNLSNYGFVIEKSDREVTLIKVTHSHFSRAAKDQTLFFMADFTDNNGLTVEGFPMQAETYLLITANTVDYLKSLSDDELKDIFSKICNNAQMHAATLYNYYNYLEEDFNNADAWSRFLKKLLSHIKGIDEYQELFGPQTFIYGQSNQYINNLSYTHTWDTQNLLEQKESLERKSFNLN